MNPMTNITRRRNGGAPSVALELMRLEEPFQRMMRQFPIWDIQNESISWLPRLDLVEAEDHYDLTAEVPGVDPKDVELNVEGSILTLKGDKRSAHEERGERYQLSERCYGSFERSLTLPSAADPEQIQAEHANGVLKIRIGKRPETRGRKIQVKAAK
jgi:HSP20 family protein